MLGVDGLAVLARVGLCADADNVALLDAALSLGSDADGDTDDFVADDDGVRGLALWSVSIPLCLPLSL